MNELNRKKDPCDDFHFLLERFSRLAARERMQVIPCSDAGPIFFRRLPSDMQFLTLANFERYVRVAEDVVRSGGSLADDPHFLWRMFHRLGVHPVIDVMDSIERGVVVEIYNPAFVQVFRNFRFFSICSYTLDELLCRPFFELFHREQAVTSRIIEVAGSIFAGKISGIHRWDTGRHVVDELSSHSLYHSVIENKIVSPLYDASGNVASVLHTFEVISCERRDSEIN